MESDRWQFQSEAYLETFVWEYLEPLLGLKPLARQQWLNNQVCDILAVAPDRQLVIIELKNTEDRYVVQQLTRYYHAVLRQQLFADQVDYNLPIRLLAIAPQFHEHNWIDRLYCHLSLEFIRFQIQEQDGRLYFELLANDQRLSSLDLPPSVQSWLVSTTLETEPPPPAISPPPKSLRKLLEGLPTLEQQERVLAVRERILQADDRMMEVGYTTTTSYGLRKGADDLYKGKRCAEFMPCLPGVNRPRLLLLLPFPKREAGGPAGTYKPHPVKGFAWAAVYQPEAWTETSPVKLHFYLGKSRLHYSQAFDLQQYAAVYSKLTGLARDFNGLDNVLTLALEEWQAQLLDQPLPL